MITMKLDTNVAHTTPVPTGIPKQYNPNAPDWVAPTSDVPDFVPSNLNNPSNVSSCLSLRSKRAFRCKALMKVFDVY